MTLQKYLELLINQSTRKTALSKKAALKYLNANWDSIGQKITDEVFYKVARPIYFAISNIVVVQLDKSNPTRPNGVQVLTLLLNYLTETQHSNLK